MTHLETHTLEFGICGTEFQKWGNYEHRLKSTLSQFPHVNFFPSETDYNLMFNISSSVQTTGDLQYLL